ncbi:mechanosensitive ion channel-like protein [Tamilnaduibacter salinus]|uniref:Mechanosensitive ion channel-like protein n=1 Tax=Tamilnaduibacter salinus TaxID=1484056 RepID=A0A2U1CZ61_9GAMM|nr:mechanosensitive ion channel-like protein [Tamilnaduibacter salinus]
MDTLSGDLMDWLTPTLLAFAAVAVTVLVYHILLRIVRRLTRSKAIGRMFLDSAAKPLGVSLCLMVLHGVLRAVPQDLPMLGLFLHIATPLLILSLTWAAVRCTAAIGDVIVTLNPVQEGEWRRARKVETQTRFLVRGLNVLIVIIGLGSALMTFNSVQQLGTSLLASAGIGGIILGFAARPVLGNLLAGMQIALTQPFRIDDVLNVQGEWCWVEEVTATYVVLRVWDLRRLVMPLQWFIENPFQNWSRNNADMLGTVFLWVDYAMPIEPLRDEFSRLLRTTELWDGQLERVQVTDSDERAMQVRFLMSAQDSSRSWDLRCLIREGMVTFVQRYHADCLPRLRAQVVGRTEDDANGFPGANKKGLTE